MDVRAERKKRLVAPCVRGCPAGIDVPRYIALVEQGRFSEAVAVVRERSPFPSVCARVCYHPCEDKCRRASMDTPVAINSLKRAAVDHGKDEVWRRKWASTIAPATGKRLAVIGAGPAGLTAAYYLGKRCGHEIIVFDDLPQPGGQLLKGIPAYRLPLDVMEQEISVITETRVEIQCDTEAESPATLLRNGFDAVFVATGAGNPRPIGLPGSDLAQVLDCVEFLAEANMGKSPKVGPRVAIVGGGNVALDGARAALRLGGADVSIVYRRSRKEMPAYDFEVEEAETEGVQFTYLAAPVAFTQGPSGVEMRVGRMVLGEPDESGRRRPQPSGEQYMIEVDTVLNAIGQEVRVPSEWGLETDRWGSPVADKETQATPHEGIFAGGDVVTGPLSVTEAIASGRRAAIAIDRYLGGDGDISEELAPDPEAGLEMPAELLAQGTERPPQREIQPEERIGDFREVVQGFTRQDAVQEARRCVRCDLWRLAGVPSVWPKGKK